MCTCVSKGHLCAHVFLKGTYVHACFQRAPVCMRVSEGHLCGHVLLLLCLPGRAPVHTYMNMLVFCALLYMCLCSLCMCARPDELATLGSHFGESGLGSWIPGRTGTHPVGPVCYHLGLRRSPQGGDSRVDWPRVRGGQVFRT